MSMTKIRIRGYRGFRASAELKLAVPNGQQGSGLTVVTGPNNAGKSCIVEAIRLRKIAVDPSLTIGMRNAATDLSRSTMRSAELPKLFAP